LAIPIGIVMFFLPRINEWLFQYDELTLRFYDNCSEASNLGRRFYSYKLKQINDDYKPSDIDINFSQNKYIYQDNINEDNMHNNENGNNSYIDNKNNNIEMHDFTKRKLLPIEKNKQYQLAFKKKRAFINFNRMVNSIIVDIKKDLFVNEKHDILPEDLAPLYSKRLNGQVENYEVRMYQIRGKLHHKNDQKNQSSNEILKNRDQLKIDLKIFLDGKDEDKKEMELKCNEKSYDYTNFIHFINSINFYLFFIFSLYYI